MIGLTTTKLEGSVLVMTSATAAAAPEIRIGRCAACKRVYRVTAGVPVPWCGCRKDTPCEIRYGFPACGGDICTGHNQTFIKFKTVKVTYKAERECTGTCWNATGDGCTCSCRGENHGKAHANGGILI
jgi:hypothetical protein